MAGAETGKTGTLSQGNVSQEDVTSKIQPLKKGKKPQPIPQSKPKPVIEPNLVFIGGIIGLICSVSIVVLSFTGILAIPLTIAAAVFVIFGFTGAIISLLKYPGRGFDSFIPEKLTNQRLAALIGLFAGLAFAVAIIFFPFLAFIPLGFFGLFSGLATPFVYLATLAAVPNVASAVADKWGQFWDEFTANTIFDFFKWIFESFKTGFKAEFTAKKWEKKNKWENRGLIAGILIGLAIVLATICGTLITSAFIVTLPFSAPTVALFVGCAAIFTLLFPGLFCVPFKYAGRIMDMASEKGIKYQKLAALIGFVLGLGIFVVEILNLVPVGFGVIKSALTALLRPGLSILSKITDALGLAGAWASLFDKKGHGIDVAKEKAAGQKPEEKAASQDKVQDAKPNPLAPVMAPSANGNIPQQFAKTQEKPRFSQTPCDYLGSILLKWFAPCTKFEPPPLSVQKDPILTPLLSNASPADGDS